MFLHVQSKFFRFYVSFSNLYSVKQFQHVIFLKTSFQDSIKNVRLSTGGSIVTVHSPCYIGGNIADDMTF